MARRTTLPLDDDGSDRFLPWLIGLMVFLAALATGAGFAVDAALYRAKGAGRNRAMNERMPEPVAAGS